MMGPSGPVLSMLVGREGSFLGIPENAAGDSTSQMMCRG